MDSASHLSRPMGAQAAAADSARKAKKPRKKSVPYSSSSSTQKGVRLWRRRQPTVCVVAGNGDENITFHDLGLPLGMSFAAILSKVLDGKSESQEWMHVDQLSKICISAMKESLQNIYGERFDHFVRNFEKSFGSTLKTLRLINKAIVNEQAGENFLAQGNANCSSLSSISSKVVDDHRAFVSFCADEELQENLEVNPLNSQLGCVSNDLAVPKFNHSMLSTIEEQENANCSSVSSSNDEVVYDLRSSKSSIANAPQETLQVNSLNNQLIIHGLMNQFGCVSKDLAGPKFKRFMLNTIDEQDNANCSSVSSSNGKVLDDLRSSESFSADALQETLQVNSLSNQLILHGIMNQFGSVSNNLSGPKFNHSMLSTIEELENPNCNSLFSSNSQVIDDYRASMSSNAVEESEENGQSNQLVCLSNGQRNQLQLACVSNGQINQLSCMSNGQINQLQLACVSNGQINQLACVSNDLHERSIVEQRRSNDLKTVEIGLNMKKLEMKQSQLSMSSYSIYLDKIKIRMGLSKASFKEEKLNNQIQDTVKSELLKIFNDLLLSGTFCMLIFLACGVYVYSYEKVMTASSTCLASPAVHKGWSKYIWPNSLSLMSSSLRCQIQVYSRVSFSLWVILVAVHFLLKRPAATSGQTMPLTVMMILGVVCGYAGKFSVDLFGGIGLYWILFWEAICLIHFFANVFPAAYHYFLYGPVSVSERQPKARIIPYQLRRYTVYCILVLILPALCGLLPFASLHDWKDLLTQNLLLFASLRDWKEYLKQNILFSKVSDVLFRGVHSGLWH